MSIRTNGPGHGNNALWFRRQPHSEAKGKLIFNVFFAGGSAGVPAVPATFSMSEWAKGKRVKFILRHTFYKGACWEHYYEVALVKRMVWRGLQL